VICDSDRFQGTQEDTQSSPAAVVDAGSVTSLSTIVASQSTAQPARYSKEVIIFKRASLLSGHLKLIGQKVTDDWDLWHSTACSLWSDDTVSQMLDTQASGSAGPAPLPTPLPVPVATLPVPVATLPVALPVRQPVPVIALPVSTPLPVSLPVALATLPVVQPVPVVLPVVGDGPLDLSAPIAATLPVVLPVTLPVYDAGALEGGVLAVEADPDPTNPDIEKKDVRIRLRRVLRAGLATVGLTAAKARKDTEKKDVEVWPSIMGLPPKEKEELLAWPKHDRWQRHEDSLSGPEGSLRTPTNIEKERYLGLNRYNRVPDTLMPLQGPPYQWRHGVIPGMGVKPPTLEHPLRADPERKEPKTVEIDLADLRSLHARNRRMIEYINAVCHTSDILMECASRFIPEGVPERDIMNDAFQIGREATQNVLATGVANHQSHVIFERLLLESRDPRKQVTYLDSRTRAAARVRPANSDTHILGAEYVTLEKDIKDFIDSNKEFNEAKAARAAAPAASSSRYTGKSASASKSSRGHGQAYRSSGKSAYKSVYKQDYRKDKSSNDGKPYSGGGSSNNSRRGNRGRGRGNRDQK